MERDEVKIQELRWTGMSKTARMDGSDGWMDESTTEAAVLPLPLPLPGLAFARLPHHDTRTPQLASTRIHTFTMADGMSSLACHWLRQRSTRPCPSLPAVRDFGRPLPSLPFLVESACGQYQTAFNALGCLR